MTTDMTLEQRIEAFAEYAAPVLDERAIADAARQFAVAVREETWNEACKAQREADRSIADSLIPGSYKKNIDHRPLVPCPSLKVSP
jgi:hypothetical protein